MLGRRLIQNIRIVSGCGNWIRAQCWEGTQLQDPMPSKAETQVGEVLEAELADDHTHECA